MRASRWVAFAALAGAILLSAGPAAPSGHAGAESVTLRYTVRLAGLAERALDVTLEIGGLGSDSLVIHGVPAYMDNPVGAADGEVVGRFEARDEGGDRLAVEASVDSRGEPVFCLRGVGDAVEVRYRLDVRFTDSPMTERYGKLIPFMDDERAWLCGNYVFCYPELAPSRRATIRVPADIVVKFEKPDDVALVGLSEETNELRNLYELMSLQFGFGSFVIDPVGGDGTPYTIVYLDSLDFDAEERSALRTMTTQIVSQVEEFFGGTPFESFGFLYFRREGTGGLEGSNLCQTYVREGTDVADATDPAALVFYNTALHELFHTWNPIYMFALDDPWIKEGVSCYYDKVLSVRLGYADGEVVEQALTGQYEGFWAGRLEEEVALTDSRLWDREYDGEEWRLQTYVRGQIAALMLDVFIREETGNAKTLDDVVRALYRDFARGTYTHGQLLGTIADETGADAGAFFERYVDGFEVPAPDEVRSAVARARELGVFGGAK